MTRQNFGVLVGIMALAIMSRFDSIISPSVAAIQASFPRADPSTVESVVSIGSSAAIVSALLFGQLLTRMSFRTAACISCLCVAMGGLMPLLVHSSVSQLLLFALVVGFGVGIATTVLPSLSARFFRGKQLAALMGLVLAVQDGSSMLVLALGGVLAKGGWLHNYWLYFLALPALVLVVFMVPGVGAVEEESEKVTESQTSPSQKGRQCWWATISCILIGFLSIFLVAVLYNKLAVYIAKYGLGGTSAAGVALMFNTGSSVVIGLSINGIKRVCQQWTIPVAFLLMALGALLFLATRSFPLVCLSAFLVGSGSAINMATCPFLLSNLTPQRRYPLVMGVFSATTSLGFTASTWAFKAFSTAFGLNPVTGSFMGMLIIALLAAVILSLVRFQSCVESRFIEQ
ncbi:MFS transporter [Bifidobacterium asteroides]|uniref:MFS transporter n=1 Tax=Bifidobacterium asteroides TaxID=1684 RepID=UPI0020C37C27|nr:MFS transporter [Bifidobacterium asteroides]MCP8614059.1 MFS transporter [Bifidobacterium asteroides]